MFECPRRLGIYRAEARTSRSPPDPEGPYHVRHPHLEAKSTRPPPRSPPRSMPTSLPEIEAAEIPRRHSAFLQELRPSGEVSAFLVLRATILSVRMERCVEYENATLAERVRRAILDFVPPEGDDRSRRDCQASHRGRDPGRLRHLGSGGPGPPLRGRLGAKLSIGPSRSCAWSSGPPGRPRRRRARPSSTRRWLRFCPRRAWPRSSPRWIARSVSGASRSPAGSSPRPDLGALGGRFDVPITIGRRR